MTQHPDSVKRVYTQKGTHKAQVPCSPPLPEEEPFLRGPALELVATVLKEPGPIQPSANSSPVLKTKAPPKPGFLSHLPSCDCLLCASPALSTVCLRWVLVTAGVRLATGHKAQGLDLLQAVLKGCPAATKRFTQNLQTSLNHKAPPSCVPSLFDEIMAQVYTHLALECLNQTSEKSLGKVLASGLKFVATRIQYLEFWQASLLLVQALAKLARFSCCTSELFANAWGWQPPLVKIPPVLEPSKIRRQKCSGQGRQRVASAPSPLHSSSQEGLEEGPPCTPKPPGRARQAGPRVPFTIFEDIHPTKSKLKVPLAPRVHRRAQTRLKVSWDCGIRMAFTEHAWVVALRRGEPSACSTLHPLSCGSVPLSSSLSISVSSSSNQRPWPLSGKHCGKSVQKS